MDLFLGELGGSSLPLILNYFRQPTHVEPCLPHSVLLLQQAPSNAGMNLGCQEVPTD